MTWKADKIVTATVTVSSLLFFWSYPALRWDPTGNL